MLSAEGAFALKRTSSNVDGRLSVPWGDVPEGDTIHYAAHRMRPVLVGRVPDEIATPHPRFALDRWAERLGGRAVTGVDAHGKHLFLRFEGDLTIHSHLRMTGVWATYQAGEPGPPARSPRRVWLMLRARGHEVVQINGPVLELMTESRTRFDRRLAALGPDIIADDFDVHAVVQRLRADDPTRAIGDALLDQRTVAGIGNLWKCEGCFFAGIDPWRPAGEVADDEVRAILDVTRPLMQRSARDGHMTRPDGVYRKAGRACPRCGTPIRSRGQGEDNRITYWCPACQS